LRDGKLTEANLLLDWYDEHAREMPWRVSPQDRLMGVLPDPYHVWMSEIMLQQTTVASVRDYFVKFTSRWPTVFALASAKDEDVMAAWAGLGYYARARNLLKCARVVANDMGGQFPNDEVSLQILPGIGPYTSAAIASIAFDRTATVLDGNVERVMARYHLIKEPLPLSKETLRGLATKMLPNSRFGDYSQAIMDLGATVCTPRNPSCGICPWYNGCKAQVAGVAKDLPNKIAKAKKPTRYGTCFVAVRMDGAVLLERRPDKGLLGGMLGWPGSEWTENSAESDPPFGADWTILPEEVRHTFTHFHLKLRVAFAQVPNEITQNSGHFVDATTFDANDLPTVMRKVWRLSGAVA
jgi:A/G-specific adenine glycosylase